jgi:type II secretory pathway pseudopilin PulG
MKINIKFAAFSLVEALIGIAIFGVTILAATAVSINSLKIVKDNETADYASEIMISVLEQAKKSDVTLDHPNGVYKIKIENDVIILEPINDNNLLNPIVSCEDTSEYKYPSTEGNARVCVQLRYDSNTKKISSRVVYQTRDNSYNILEIYGLKR